MTAHTGRHALLRGVISLPGDPDIGVHVGWNNRCPGSLDGPTDQLRNQCSTEVGRAFQGCVHHFSGTSRE